MKFCSKCGSFLKMDRAKRALICPRCGHEESAENNIVYVRSSSDKEKVVILGKKELNIRTTPQVKNICPKCGNNKAYWWMVQTRGVDESTTQLCI